MDGLRPTEAGRRLEARERPAGITLGGRPAASGPMPAAAGSRKPVPLVHGCPSARGPGSPCSAVARTPSRSSTTIPPRWSRTRPAACSSPRSFVVVSRVVPTSSASCSCVSRMWEPRGANSPDPGAAVASRQRTAATRWGAVLRTVSASRCSTSASRRPSPAMMRVAMRVSASNMVRTSCSLIRQSTLASWASANPSPMRCPMSSISPNSDPGPSTANVTRLPSGEMR
jgi:hypothetical protein